MVLHTFLTLISSKTEKPQKPYGLRGILYWNTMSSCDNKSIFRLYYSMIVATFPILLYVHLHGIRPVYYGVQMVIFRAIHEEKSKFSAVSVWFIWILLSWCYHYSISSFPLLVSNVNSISINTSIKALSSSLNNL